MKVLKLGIAEKVGDVILHITANNRVDGEFELNIEFMEVTLIDENKNVSGKFTHLGKITKVEYERNLDAPYSKIVSLANKNFIVLIEDKKVGD